MSRELRGLEDRSRYPDNEKRKNCYLTSRARLDLSARGNDSPTASQIKGRKASAAYWAPCSEVLPKKAIVYPIIVHDKGFYEARRQAIYFIYVHLLEHPPLSSDVCNKICGILQIPKGSRRCVSATIRKIIESIESKETFSGKCKRIRTDHLVVEFSPQADVVYSSILDGLSINDTVCRVNTWREQQNPPLERLSFSTIQRFISSSECIKSTIRKKVKKGNTDLDSEWAEGKYFVIFAIKLF